MKIRVVVEFDVQFDTDGAELDRDFVFAETYSVLASHVEDKINDMMNDNEINGVIDDIVDATMLDVSELTWWIDE